MDDLLGVVAVWPGNEGARTQGRSRHSPERSTAPRLLIIDLELGQPVEWWVSSSSFQLSPSIMRRYVSCTAPQPLSARPRETPHSTYVSSTPH